MGQKVHPVAFRLGLNQRHQSEWFQPKHIYPELIIEYQMIRQKLFAKYTQICAGPNHTSYLSRANFF